MSQFVAPLPTPSPDWALFLDFDGTLVELAPTPDEVRIPSELPDILKRLSAVLNGAVALVSGRKLSDLDHFLSPLNLPVAGQHGAELRGADVGAQTFAPIHGVAPLLPAIEEFAARRPGLLVEAKGFSVAVHYRKAPAYQDELRDFLASLVAGHPGGLETIQGHSVLEIKPRAMNKGLAVRRFMEGPPFHGRFPVFIGDDRTDEDGFHAALSFGGAAIKVGLGGESLAPAHIADPAATRRWLLHVCDALSQSTHLGAR
jgi:trehalose 6-phosphate phosphatase